MKNNLRKKTWGYKDGNREYWSIEAKETRRITADEVFGNKDNEYFETEWRVKILFSSSGSFTGKNFKEVYSTILETQYDEPIDLSQILTNWISYTTAISIGMAEHAKAV